MSQNPFTAKVKAKKLERTTVAKSSSSTAVRAGTKNSIGKGRLGRLARSNAILNQISVGDVVTVYWKVAGEYGGGQRNFTGTVRRADSMLKIVDNDDVSFFYPPYVCNKVKVKG